MTATDETTLAEEFVDPEAQEFDDPSVGLSLQTKKFALQHLLDKAASVVPSKDILPVLKNFQVEAKGGSVRVTATDLELSVVATSEMVTVTKEGSAVFPAKRLMEIVKEAEDGDLIITVKDGEAKVEVGRTHWTLKLMSGDDYPELPEIDKIEFHEIDRAKFVGWIRCVRYAAATETVRPSLMVIDIAGGQMRATDGVRFQQVTVGKEIPIDISIPINAVDDLVKILSTTEAPKVELGQDDESLFFKVGGDVFIAQKLNAVFPDLDEQLLKPALANDQILNVDRGDLVKAIKRVRITADPETNAVILALSTNKMNVKSKDKYGSTCEEELDVKWGGKDREIAFNHTHLLQMLGMTDLSSCEFRLGEDTKTRPSPLLLRDDAAGQVGMLNQLRVDWIN